MLILPIIEPVVWHTVVEIEIKEDFAETDFLILTDDDGDFPGVHDEFLVAFGNATPRITIRRLLKLENLGSFESAMLTLQERDPNRKFTDYPILLQQSSGRIE